MRRIWTAALLLLALAGCGVQPSEVADGGRAPTGVASGVTLYFVDAEGGLVPQLRETDRLGSISEALSLLFTGPGHSELSTDIPEEAPRQVVVTARPDRIELRVPLAFDELTRTGIDQIVCTALGVHVQSGGSTDTTAVLQFTQTTAESKVERSCPLTG
ncbi:hypothetical protein [Glycomyces salinus]|uniref:hypothetical protein n=1 Tax=Glycomyces salinus TaxID=980294 RepID=UPI0018ECE94A|nr:hypothetical protein [Glycomyces salinus]